MAVRQLALIAQILLTMLDRLTRLSISQWTKCEDSYRTIQRFFSCHLGWPTLIVKFLKTHLFNSNILKS